MSGIYEYWKSEKSREGCRLVLGLVRLSPHYQTEIIGVGGGRRPIGTAPR